MAHSPFPAAVSIRPMRPGAMLLVTALLTASMPALAADPLTAGSVSTRCQAQANPDQARCQALADGFLSGYLTGVQKGIRSTYEHDPQVLETTRGHTQTYERYREVEAHTLCLPADLQGKAAIDLFLRFMGSNPGNEDEPFGDVMEAALDAAFRCPAAAAPAPPAAKGW
ncbi:hypothetical protein GT347_19935 [Xylophilus rhododendri]|uniref:Rap1a immunity protein domain-containing protein n=1 Tax=Xylophilus rhododendri TaxID=2697032 RepID=A0A857JA86_9BURK|nr:Rap1a/Tai family immunity protein [Xylophilus rhododendri]QHJ00052.1 hypothetical protein GT347_19935 [Xylophilus rhododendri]